MEEILQVKNLCKTFRLSQKQRKLEGGATVKKAVDNLSFTAYKGEIFGLLGPNGAGKTTTLRMLATLIKPDSGDAVIDGASIVNDAYGVRSKIGFLTSELKLEDFFTPNYLYDFFSKLYNVPQEKIASRKKEMFERFGIDKFAEVKVANLSTGMRQKTSLVISLVNDPDFIIFDEPTRGIDIGAKSEMYELMEELAKQGKSVIMISSELAEIQRLSDRVIIMCEGRITGELDIKDATQEEIMKYATMREGL